jgi:hypothetical protein
VDELKAAFNACAVELISCSEAIAELADKDKNDDIIINGSSFIILLFSILVSK